MPVDPQIREIEVLEAIVAEINSQVAASSGVVTAATDASPIEITTATEHGLYSGASVTIAEVEGNTAANGTWPITVVSATKFTLTGSVGDGTYTEGGTWAGGRFTAQQAFNTDYKGSLLKMLRVDVRLIPESEMAAADRQPNADSTDEWYRYEISVQKAVNAEAIAEVNALIRLSKRIQSLFYVNRELSSEVVIEESEPELYNQVCLRGDSDRPPHYHSRLNLKVRDTSR